MPKQLESGFQIRIKRKSLQSVKTLRRRLMRSLSGCTTAIVELLSMLNIMLNYSQQFLIGRLLRVNLRAQIE